MSTILTPEKIVELRASFVEGALEGVNEQSPRPVSRNSRRIAKKIATRRFNRMLNAHRAS